MFRGPLTQRLTRLKDFRLPLSPFLHLFSSPLPFPVPSPSFPPSFHGSDTGDQGVDEKGLRQNCQGHWTREEEVFLERNEADRPLSALRQLQC